MSSSTTDFSEPLQTPKLLLELVQAPELGFLMEAHDAVSAKIVERAGFDAIWASGLTISSSLGFRDANEASWLHLVDTIERMANVVSVPILVDADSGFGNFNNARLTARKLCDRGAAGICIEDKEFPKLNSFVGDRHPLADIGEFCGRIKAIRDTVTRSDFVLVARIEALIAGHSEAEALRRAEAYVSAGADAVLIHSRRSDASEILSFADRWQNRAPVVIVPTKYFNTPTDVYRDAGISTVIWANHSLRAAITAMTALCHKVRTEQTVATSEESIATLEQLFDLLSYDELADAEMRFLPKLHREVA
ncbi:phosphoenolpyruvate mutase [Roseibium sp. ROS1]